MNLVLTIQRLDFWPFGTDPTLLVGMELAVAVPAVARDDFPMEIKALGGNRPKD